MIRLELEAGAVVGRPDAIGFDPADDRQADDHAIAAVKIVRLVDHETVSGDVADMQCDVTALQMLGDHRNIDRMPRRAPHDR